MPPKPQARRASTLAGAHPVDDQRHDTEPGTATAHTARPAKAAARPGATHARQSQAVKFSATVDIDVLDGVKDAFWAARNHGRYRVLGDLVTEALRDKMTELANEFNNGQPFPRRPIDHLPPGRVVS